jgi:hypothetical protein
VVEAGVLLANPGVLVSIRLTAFLG